MPNPNCRADPKAFSGCESKCQNTWGPGCNIQGEHVFNDVGSLLKQCANKLNEKLDVLKNLVKDTTLTETKQRDCNYYVGSVAYYINSLDAISCRINDARNNTAGNGDFHVGKCEDKENLEIYPNFMRKILTNIDLLGRRKSRESAINGLMFLEAQYDIEKNVVDQAAKYSASEAKNKFYDWYTATKREILWGCREIYMAANSFSDLLTWLEENLYPSRP